jgi:hypothetical protein
MLVAGYAAGLLPAGPARLGVFEAALVAPLALAGMATSEAILVAIALHSVVLVDVILGGLISVMLPALAERATPA